jgi:large subunit ribosomal protein L18e
MYVRLAQKTKSDFNKKIVHRLSMSRKNKGLVHLKNIVHEMEVQPHRIAVVVSSVVVKEAIVTPNMPKLYVCALRFSHAARAMIEGAGGMCLTLDQLAQLRPTGEGCVFIKPVVDPVSRMKRGIPGSKKNPGLTKTKVLSRRAERGRPDAAKLLAKKRAGQLY